MLPTRSGLPHDRVCVRECGSLASYRLVGETIFNRSIRESPNEPVRGGADAGGLLSTLTLSQRHGALKHVSQKPCM